MAHGAGVEAAPEHGTHLVVLAGVAGAAEIVDVVVAVGGEEIAGRGAAGAVGRVEAAIGEGHIVVDRAAAVAGRQLRAPAFVEAIVETRSGVAGMDADRLLPWLEAEHAGAIGMCGDHRAAEQLVAGDRALAAGLVVGVQLQGGVRADLPVGGQRQLAVVLGGQGVERLHAGPAFLAPVRQAPLGGVSGTHAAPSRSFGGVTPWG